MEKHKTNILLELIDDVIVKYPNTEEYIQQKLLGKCKKEGILIDMVIFFSTFQKQKKDIFTNHAYKVFIVKYCLMFCIYLFEV